MLAISAAQSFAAVSSNASNTGCRSKVERLITLSTSAVAVCCLSDCLSSLSNRAFSMAITACAAKFVTSSICLSVKRRTSWREKIRDQVHHLALVQQWNAQERPYATKLTAEDSHWIVLSCVDLLCRNVPDMSHRSFGYHAADWRMRIGTIWRAPNGFGESRRGIVRCQDVQRLSPGCCKGYCTEFIGSPRDKEFSQLRIEDPNDRYSRTGQRDWRIALRSAISISVGRQLRRGTTFLCRSHRW